MGPEQDGDPVQQAVAIPALRARVVRARLTHVLAELVQVARALGHRVRVVRVLVVRVREDRAVRIAVTIVETIGVTINLEVERPIGPVDAPTIGRVLVEALVVDPAGSGASTAATSAVMIAATAGVTTGAARRRVPAGVDSHLVRRVTRSGLRRTRPNDAAPQCALAVLVRFAKASSRHESNALPRSGSTKDRCVRSPSRRPNEVVRRRRLRNAVMPNVQENSHPMWRPRSTTSSNRVVQRD